MADTAASTDAAPVPEVAAPAPEVAAAEVSAPAAEVAAPAAEVAAPAPEVAAPAPEVVAPAPEVVAPAAEVPKTEAEVPKPEVAAAADAPAAETPAAAAEGDEKKETYASLPKPKYNPMHSHTVHHSRSYASTVIADQEMLLANLRNMRRELEKEDRQLSIMAKTLFNQEYPRKWTPPNSYKSEGNLRGGYALISISKRSTDY